MASRTNVWYLESASPGRPAIPIRVTLPARECSDEQQADANTHAVVSTERKRNHEASAAVDSVTQDSNVVVLESSDDDVVEVPAPASTHPSHKELQKPGVPRHPRLSVAQLLSSLHVVEVDTSGHHNNCLWFSTHLAMGEFDSSDQHSSAVRERSDIGRKSIHDEVMRALPDGTGRNHVWWAGWSRQRAEQVFKYKMVMGEAHLYACAQLLQMCIVVVDTRFSQIQVRLYSPGYLSPMSSGTERMSHKRAKRVRFRKSSSKPPCIWVRLAGIHFSALISVQPCERSI